MKKLLLLALLFSGCATSVSMPECWKVEGPGTFGSAVPIVQSQKKLWLLTAKHNLPVFLAGGLSVIDQIAHPKLDVALISVEGTAKVLPPLATKRPFLAARLYASGWQLGALLITGGYQGGKLGRMSCPLYYGASGGPVWNKHGQLVGINSRVARARDSSGDLYLIPHVSVYTPVIDLADWIKKNTK